MYLDTIWEQSRVFLYSCGAGFLLAILYDVFYFIRLFLPEKKIFIVPVDIIFMLLCTFFMFLFSLSVHNGSFKFYVYLGALLGFFICYFSFGAFVRRVFLSFAEGVKNFFRKFRRRILENIIKIRKKGAEKKKKSEISSNLLLQDDESMLYNVMDNEKKESGEKDEIFF